MTCLHGTCLSLAENAAGPFALGFQAPGDTEGWWQLQRIPSLSNAPLGKAGSWLGALLWVADGTGDAQGVFMAFPMGSRSSLVEQWCEAGGLFVLPCPLLGFTMDNAEGN